MQHKAGFTLIELSIVMVIIGLIVGGVLLGRDLIFAADMRSTLRQAESYRLSMNAFKLKYGALPGDIGSAGASAAGFASRSGELGSGNENGLIEACNGDGATGGGEYMGCENMLMWRDLSESGLINEQLTSAMDASLIGFFNWDTVLPKVKNVSNAYAVVYSKRETVNVEGYTVGFASRNILLLAGLGLTDADASVGSIPRLTPLQSYALDGKADDGLPLTGTIQSVTSNNALYNVEADLSIVCHASGGVANIYATDSTRGSQPICKTFFLY